MSAGLSESFDGSSGGSEQVNVSWETRVFSAAWFRYDFCTFDAERVKIDTMRG